MSDTIRMWLCGTECELRPLSAKKYLGARSEAAAVNEAFGGDENTQELSFAACIVAEGAFSDGERLFSSGAQVLETLTAQEIMDAGDGYILKRESNGQTEAKSVGAENVKTETDVRNISDESVKALPFEDLTPDGKADDASRTLLEMFRAPGAQAEVKGGAAAFDWSLENSGGYKTAGGTGAAEYMAESGLRTISDFFERDSRRYDEAFLRY